MFGAHGRTVLLKVGTSYANLQPKPGSWIFLTGEARTGYSETFEAAAQVVVNHNLGRMPCCVAVRTLGGAELDCEVLHLNVNQLILNFDSLMAGRIEMV